MRLLEHFHISFVSLLSTLKPLYPNVQCKSIYDLYKYFENIYEYSLCQTCLYSSKCDKLVGYHLKLPEAIFTFLLTKLNPQLHGA